MKFALPNMRTPHGQFCVCPNCGTVGRFQNRHSKRQQFGDYVHYNMELEMFLCHACEDRQ